MNGFWNRIAFAFRAFFSILFKGRLAGDIIDAALRARDEVPASEPAGMVPHAPAPAGASPPAPAPGDAPDRAVQILALLQRDGRLVDFLMEDLSAYPDAQVGAAVRDVHSNCRQALARYVTVESILDGQEGGPITVSDRVDPAEVRLVGNVAGGPPFHGTLLHRGWRVAHVALPPLGEGSLRTVVAQAEVEVA